MAYKHLEEIHDLIVSLKGRPWEVTVLNNLIDQFGRNLSSIPGIPDEKLDKIPGLMKDIIEKVKKSDEWR